MFIDDHVRDNGLAVIASADDAFHITRQEVTNLTDLATYTLGNKTGIAFTGPATPDGHKISA